jgi:hypothetical protein
MAQNANSADNERKKQILAGVLGVLALGVLGYTLFGGSSSKKPNANYKSQVVGGNNNSDPTVYQPIPDPRNLNDPTLDPGFQYYPISFSPIQPASGVAARNIFAFPPPPPPYVPPTPKPYIPKPTPIPPTPTPTPPPPVFLASVSPGSIFAGTGDFTLTVAGDKFTPETRIYFGDRELATRYVSPNQLNAIVPADLIKFAGGRQIIVKTPDGVLYSNVSTLAIQEPPKPDNFTYVGMIGTRFRNDTAILKDKTKASRPGEDLVAVQRGDVIGGRFRVLSISDKEVVFVDTAIKLNHRIPMDDAGKKGLAGIPSGVPGQPRYQPPPSKGADDDEEEDP